MLLEVISKLVKTQGVILFISTIIINKCFQLTSNLLRLISCFIIIFIHFLILFKTPNFQSLTTWNKHIWRPFLALGSIIKKVLYFSQVKILWDWYKSFVYFKFVNQTFSSKSNVILFGFDSNQVDFLCVLSVGLEKLKSNLFMILLSKKVVEIILIICHKRNALNF